ncbi:MAG TPA: hypothetical protein V6C58_03600, partial [Allocoleopsis sp.]
MSSIRFNTVNSESDLHINDISSNGIALVSGGGNVNIGSNTIGSKKLTVTGDFHVTNSAASTSSSTGSITTPGGIGISNTTNASSVSNGGSFTTAGGIAVAKDIYSGQSLFVTGTSQVSTTDNTITGVEGTINTQGDLVLYNGTKNTVVFREVGIAAPSLTNRSAGTKLVLYP